MSALTRTERQSDRKPESRSDSHRSRLEELMRLAQTYRGCSRKELARELGRDASNLIPDSGIPKIDLVARLARLLDWPVEDVVNAICGEEAGAETPEAGQDDFEAADRAALVAHQNGCYAEMIQLARRAYAIASSAEERVRACNREAGGWDGLGRFRNALEVLQRGLREHGASRDRQLLLRSNLANAHYSLWQLYEGVGVAGDVIQSLEADPPTTIPALIARATARYVRGHCRRRMMAPGSDPSADMVETTARQAVEDLTIARQLYLELAASRQNDSYAGIANTCTGGIMEAQVMLGERTASTVLDELAGSLDALIDPESAPAGDWLESYGWSCIFACNIALRHVTDERELQQRMAIFTNKADEIARRLGNWSMRERVFTLEYARRQRFMDWTGVETDWTIDSDDVKVIAGTMGRFPEFRDTAWRILRTAKFIGKN